MTELVYHDGHYHPAPAQSEQRHGSRSGGLWQRTYEFWDHILYGVGSVYYKIRGRAEPPMPSALCFRLRPAEDLFDGANQQTAVRDCTMDLLAYGTVCCAAHDRQEAAPEDEPEVKHELGGREHP
ncbi:hypothetical protein MRS44_014761 [Fusarium solani]|nr:hypothetical protein MRS44_014761 [Fusarium solani]